MKIRTRFAPSPTGFMHVGNLRSALFTYLIAKHNNGDFILRIEDTDQKRKVDGAVDFIYDTLELCGLKIDEGPKNPGNFGSYVQSERIDIYKKYAEQLVREKKAYYCFCTEERLEHLREKANKQKVAFMYDGHCKNLSEEEIKEKLDNNEPYVIRFAMPKEGVSIYNDKVFGEIKVDNKILEDMVLIKSDGYPTYNFSNIVDDHLMNITHVTRGVEYLMSTPKYNYVYDAFGWEHPNYVHLPQVLGEDGKKLSKRNGDANFMDLYNDGYPAEAIINYLVLLGWTSKDNKEIFTLEELEKEFDVDRIVKSPAIYDVKKLNWVSSHYIKELSDEKLCEITIPHLKNAYNLEEKNEEWIKELILLYRNHISYGKQIVEETSLFFKEDIKIGSEEQEFMDSDNITNEVIKCFKEEIENDKEFSIESIKECINNVKEKTGAKGKLLFMPIRIKITGQMHGPELANTIHLLGKDTVLNRLK